MQSTAATVPEYLAGLPADRREALETLRDLVRQQVPDAQETMSGMATYELGGTMLCALASQKNHLALYVCESGAVDAHRTRLGKLPVGKGCIRFRRLADLPLDVIADLLADAADHRRRSV